MSRLPEMPAGERGVMMDRAAAKLFENHPHFTIFPGESVEIMPVLPIPGT